MQPFEYSSRTRIRIPPRQLAVQIYSQLLEPKIFLFPASHFPCCTPLSAEFWTDHIDRISNPFRRKDIFRVSSQVRTVMAVLMHCVLLASEIGWSLLHTVRVVALLFLKRSESLIANIFKRYPWLAGFYFVQPFKKAKNSLSEKFRWRFDLSSIPPRIASQSSCSPHGAKWKFICNQWLVWWGNASECLVQLKELKNGKCFVVTVGSAKRHVQDSTSAMSSHHNPP